MAPRHGHVAGKPAAGSCGTTHLVAAAMTTALLALAILWSKGSFPRELPAAAASTASSGAPRSLLLSDLSDSYRDLSDLIPLMESHLERSITQAGADVDAHVARLMDAVTQGFERAEHRDADWVVDEQCRRARRAEVLPSRTTPPFSYVQPEPEEARQRFSPEDPVWRLLRRYFLEDRSRDPNPHAPRLVIDAGCGGGTTALYAAASGYRVLCLEVDAGAAWLARQSAEANPDFGWQLWVVVAGISAERGSAWMPASALRGAWAWADLRLRPLDDGGGPGIEVPLHRLDALVTQPAALLRLDVGGWEAAALRGANGMLRSLGVGALLVSLAPARWDGLGVRLDEGIAALQGARESGPYKTYVLPRRGRDSPCPAEELARLGLGGPASGLRLRRADDSGDESASDWAVELVEPVGQGLAALITTMAERKWTCDLWMERPTPPDAVPVPGGFGSREDVAHAGDGAEGDEDGVAALPRAAMAVVAAGGGGGGSGGGGAEA